MFPDETRDASRVLRTDPDSARSVQDWAELVREALATPLTREITEGRAATAPPVSALKDD